MQNNVGICGDVLCGTTFLREFNLRIGDFLCFAETNFCD